MTMNEAMWSGHERVIPERWSEEQIDAMVGAGPVGNIKFNVRVQRMRDGTYNVLVRLNGIGHIFHGDLKNATDMVNVWTDKYYGASESPIPTESQRKSPTAAKTRTRPQLSKRSLMKE